MVGVLGKYVLQFVEALVAFFKIFTEPFENLTDFKLSVSIAIACAVSQKTAHAVFQLRIKFGSRKGFRKKRRAANAGAVHGHMNAWLGVFGAKLFVLDPVQVMLLTQQGEKLLFPGWRDERAQVFDGFQIRVFGQDDFNRERVVGVDQKGHLLRFGPFVKVRFGRGAHTIKHLLQLGTVGGETFVIHAGLLVVRQPFDMFFQQRLPACVAMVEAAGVLAESA